MVEISLELIFKQNERILKELRDIRVSLATKANSADVQTAIAEVKEVKNDLSYVHEDLQDIKERLSKLEKSRA